jgi:hypothetical protein
MLVSILEMMATFALELVCKDLVQLEASHKVILTG